MIRKIKNKYGDSYVIQMYIPTWNVDRYARNKTDTAVLGTFRTQEKAIELNEKVEAYWNSIKLPRKTKVFPYGEQLLHDGVLDSLDDWDKGKEYLKIADQELDYLWKLNDNGTVLLIDRVYSDGIEDETTQMRRKNNELELVFDNLPQAINWSIKKALKNHIKKYK